MNPAVAFIRFVVNDEDMFGDSNFIGQGTYPVGFYVHSFFYIDLNLRRVFVLFQIISLRSGYRSIPLKNGYSEDVSLGTLLVHITIRSNTVSKIL